MNDPVPRAWVDPLIDHPMSEAEFALFQAFIHRECGIYFPPAKRPLLAARLAERLRTLRLPSFAAYYRHVANGPEEERVQMMDRITTHETRFFREPDHFVYLERELFPRWRAAGQPRRIRVWSAACSTGEEPFTLAICLLRSFPPESGWTVEVLASDLSTAVLETARRATWPVDRASEIPQADLQRFMLKGTRAQAGWMRAGPELRAVVNFQRVNLNDPGYAIPGTFDVIFSRNVFIYFGPESRARAATRLAERLAPDGLLFVGHAESLAGVVAGLKAVAPAVYRRAGGPLKPTVPSSPGGARW